MTPSVHQMSSSAEMALEARRRPRRPDKFIEDESQWRFRPPGSGQASPEPRVVVTRWRSFEKCTRQVAAETPADGHIVAIVLRNENVHFSVSGRTLHDGAATPGMLHVTEPAAATRCVFRGPYDVLHLHVPNKLIAEISRDISGHESIALSSETSLTRDPMAEALGRALLAAERIGGSYGQLYADSVSIAIVARLLSMARRADPSERPRVAELAKWRLKRATEYIEASLANSVSLADIASAAGLTRMHFAAQFKAATGLRPHEYLLRRRIERAQEKLAGTSMSLVEVALSVGFQSQSHFTSVFKRMAGQPPRAWRQSHVDPPSPCVSTRSRASWEGCARDAGLGSQSIGMRRQLAASHLLTLFAFASVEH